MTSWCVEVATKDDLVDAEGNGVAHDIADIGIATPVQVRTSRLYWLEGDLDASSVEALATRLLTDPVAQEYALTGDLRGGVDTATVWVAEVRLKPGVTDAVGASVLKGARDIGIRGLADVATGRKYYLIGDLSEPEARSVCERLLVNEVIQSYLLRRGSESVAERHRSV